MEKPPVVSEADWIKARTQLLEAEKAFTRQRDELSLQRRKLPWVKIEKAYQFQGPDGTLSLSDLFDGRSQLAVYHFMFHPDWTEGCRSCSFWADNLNAVAPHLQQRDVSLAAVSRAPLEVFLPFKQRMGWSFPWYSSFDSDFNSDFKVSFTPEEIDQGEVEYNFGTTPAGMEEAPGLSILFRDQQGEIFRTYSCYARGLDALNSAYQVLDLVPKGRDEDNLPFSMAWVNYRDRYGQSVES